MVDKEKEVDFNYFKYVLNKTGWVYSSVLNTVDPPAHFFSNYYYKNFHIVCQKNIREDIIGIALCDWGKTNLEVFPIEEKDMFAKWVTVDVPNIIYELVNKNDD